MLQAVVEKCMEAQQHMPFLLGIVKKQSLSKGLLQAVAPLERLEQLNKATAEFAKKEVQEKFPTLLSHSSVAMWSAIEAMVEDLLIGFADSEAGFRDRLSLTYPRLKIKDGVNNSRIIERWEKELPEKAVGDRYLSMIRFFVPDISFDQIKLDCLSELAESRNAILHRAGVVDERFISKVPTNHYKPGDTIKITRERFMDYHDACASFSLLFLTKDMILKP
ncbi:hypothetical protein ABNQ38_36195 (plasmid) [Azospirillum sp. A29]|uniref:hypothetical protein n=1 Tax=Azospirillum sp. A29 TaxID=3160606 RepID=UPI00366F73BD